MTTFNLTGAVQYYIVPGAATSVTIECYGAQGGLSGGKGGKATGTLAVTPGETLYVYVGGRGASNTGAPEGPYRGYNGGGLGSSGAGGGGGASDVRQGGTTLANRVIVAGGGGGKGADASAGGVGGGTTGGNGTTAGGGTQSAGGAADGTGSAGSLGQGGSKGASTGAAGGGGGYYGGGSSDGHSAGGGSGYIGGVTDGSMTDGVRSLDGYVVITADNEAPNAPALGYPTGGTTIAVEVGQTFTWTFSDPDEGDYQSGYELRYREVGAASWEPSLTATTPVSQCVIGAGTFVDATDYEWQVRTADAVGAWGPFTSSGLFSAAATPGAPSVTDPAAEGTIATATYDVDWSVTDQDAYQVRTVADSGGSPDTGTIYTDTGTVEAAATRTQNVAFGVNDRYEHIQVRVRYNSVWSDWTSVRVHVAYTAPATPTVVLTTDDTAGYICVTATHPTPEGSQPVVTSIDIYRSEAGADAIRIAAAQQPSLPYRDYAVRSDVVYSYIVRAIGSTGTTADSAETT